MLYTCVCVTMLFLSSKLLQPLVQEALDACPGKVRAARLFTRLPCAIVALLLCNILLFGQP